MRRFADDDEVDLVIVGCGAGGSVLAQRLARAGWRVVALDAGPVLGPRHRLGQRRGRLAPPVLDRPAGDRRRRPGAAGLEQLRPRASAARWSTTPATRRASTRATSRRCSRRRSRRRLAASGTRSCAPTTRPSSRSCRSPGSTGRGATRTATRTGRTRSAATASCSCAARTSSASTAKVGPVAIANGRFGNRPHCIYRGFCLQGCKVNAKASPLITHIPDALAHGAEVRADAMVTRDRRWTSAPAGPPGCTTSGTAPAGSSGPRWWPSPATRSRRPGCC